MSNVSRGKLELAERAIRLLKGPEAAPPPQPTEPSEPTFEETRRTQIDEAREMLDRDLSDAVRYPYRDLDMLVGPKLPGDVHVAGALTGNGKSTFVFSTIDGLSLNQVPILYFPFEVDPASYLNRRAAWKLDIDVRAVLRQDWLALPKGAREAMDSALEELEHDPYVHLAPEKRATVKTIRRRAEQAVDEFDCRVVIIDHIGRVELPDSKRQSRELYADMMRDLKDMARTLKVAVICSAQLNRLNDPLDYFSPPHIARIAESAVVGHEADVTLMLSRRLRHDLPDGYTQDLKLGKITEAELAVPGVMRVTCRKHRLDDSALNRSVYLNVINGRVVDQPYGYTSSRPEAP